MTSPRDYGNRVQKGLVGARSIRDTSKMDFEDELRDWRERHGLGHQNPKRKKAPRTTKVRAPNKKEKRND